MKQLDSALEDWGTVMHVSKAQQLATWLLILRPGWQVLIASVWPCFLGLQDLQSPNEPVNSLHSCVQLLSLLTWVPAHGA